MDTYKIAFEKKLSCYEGDGPYLKINGVPYIDAASGTFNLPFGYTNKRIADKLKQQIDRCVHLSSGYTNEISQLILQQLLPHLPPGINRMWLRDVSGSGAVEGAVRIAQKATGRSGVISLFLAHHGQSLATAQISGNAFRLKNFSLDIHGSIKIPIPASVLSNQNSVTAPSNDLNNFINLDEVIRYGSSGDIACFIIEPILGNGGNIVLPQEFYQLVRKFCTR